MNCSGLPVLSFSLFFCSLTTSSGLVFQAVAKLPTKEDLTGFFDAIEVGMGGPLTVGGAWMELSAVGGAWVGLHGIGCIRCHLCGLSFTGRGGMG